MLKKQPMNATHKYCLLILVLTFTIFSVRGNDHQPINTIPSKAEDTLSLNTYLELISEHYPLIKKANLYEAFISAYNIKGKGALDPKITSNYQTKNFDSKDYFTTWNTEAKIPTRLPIDLSVGYERNDGDFINPENTVPNYGLVYGTLNLSILRGLMFDEQRYNLQMAELKGLKSQIERDALTREILYQAVLSYIEWSAAHLNNNIYIDYLETINQRHQNIIQLYLNGDKPAVDTIESRVTINTAQKLTLEAVQNLISKTQKLTLFLWDADGNPLSLNQNINPQNIASTVEQVNTLAELVNPAFVNDPKIRKITNLIEQLKLKNRLDKENLKPQLDLKYNTILNMGKNDFQPTFSLNDYKYGLTVELPILNRKTRGEIQLNNLMIEQNTLDLRQQRQNIYLKFQNYLLNREYQEEVITTVNEKITNSEALYEAEQLKFSIGESSLFMLNQRERKLLEAKIDRAKSLKKYGQIASELYYIKLGQINN